MIEEEAAAIEKEDEIMERKKSDIDAAMQEAVSSSLSTILRPSERTLNSFLNMKSLWFPQIRDCAKDVGGGDPLAVGGESGDGGRVGVLDVDGDNERVVEVHDDNGSAVGVEAIGFGVAGDQDPRRDLRRRLDQESQ
ncbi:hypothetical protein ACLB2K_020091 [Fragaria x ananassa]